jgi:ABC-type nitrate/sulfonate/bicarbonate transport system substrate-binding protein
MKFRALITITFVFLLLSCSNSEKNNGHKEVKLNFDWIPTMSFAGDIVAMNNHADKNDLSLILMSGGEGLDPIKMVISGAADIGIVGLDKLIMANEKGASLVAFAMIDNVTPTVFMSKKASNILTPEDFIGKRVGIQSGGATEFVYRSLIKKLGLDASKIQEVPIGFDMSSFINNQYDVRPGFIFDEVVYLDINNIPYNLIEPENFGLRYPGRVYFAKKEFIDKNPDLLQSIVNSVASGWMAALNDPDSAIDQLQKFEPQIDYNRELRGLEKAKIYFSGYNNQILTPDTIAINDMVGFLHELEIIRKKPRFEEYFNLQFINNFHKE